MLGYLDRFSVDLDFDYVGNEQDIPFVRKTLEQVFQETGLTIADQSTVVPQYFLKYPAPEGERNTLKIDITTLAPRANVYAPQRLVEIDRIMECHTISTMVANKLVACIDRYIQHDAIAGRDIYDIHHFLLQGYRYDEAVIVERTGKGAVQFLTELTAFIEKHVTLRTIDQDINTLLPYEQFSRIRTHLKQETVRLLRDEIARYSEV
jgi:predicted nucleotidyltransferase component of viral defense system